MANPTCYCIYCASPAQGAEEGLVKCGRCGRAFEYSAVESAPPLSYSTPATEDEAPKIDPYCRKGFVWSLFSPLFPAIAAYAFGVSSAGYVRAGEQQTPGRTLAVLAMVLSGVGLLIFGFAMHTLNNARSSAASVVCMSNLRQVSAGIAQYENTFPGATGYSIEDVAASSRWGNVPRCPLDPVDPTATGRKRSTSYILLSHLEPFGALPRNSSTPIAFEIAGHERGTGGHVNVAFADGHVEYLPLADALDAIQSGLESRISPVTQPARK